MIVKDEAGIKDILQKNHVVAIVGFSTDENKGGHYVPKFLKEHGYQIVPVNPTISEGLGEKAYASLKDIPFPVDIVDWFPPCRSHAGNRTGTPLPSARKSCGCKRASKVKKPPKSLPTQA